MAIQPRPHQTGGGNAGLHHLAGDTTYTKIFVGGLAWETQRDTMRRYFEQFGEVLEAVVITDKNTCRSKGYGFVTFRDPDSAARACVDPSPVIDGRRANCNLASLGATHRARPATPQYGMGRFRPPAATVMAASAYRGTSPASVATAYFHHPTHYALPYSFYGYSGGYSQENMYPMSYYGIGGGQHQQQQHQFSPYYPVTPAGVFPNFYPYYGHYTQSAGQGQGGFGLNYPQMIQYPYLSQQFGSASAILSLPTSIAAPTAGLNVVGAPPIGSGPSSSLPPGTNQDQKPSS